MGVCYWYSPGEGVSESSALSAAHKALCDKWSNESHLHKNYPDLYKDDFNPNGLKCELAQRHPCEYSSDGRMKARTDLPKKPCFSVSKKGVDMILFYPSVGKEINFTIDRSVSYFHSLKRK